MTRKLPYLLIAIAAVSAVSLLQAQDDAIHSSKNLAKDCAFCNAAASIVEQEKTKCCDSGCKDDCENCPGCEKGQCPSCPVCTAQSRELDTRVNAACESSDALTQSLFSLPGSASFAQASSMNTTRQNEVMAKQLAEYLSSGHHDPQQVQHVLQLALEFAARQSSAPTTLAGVARDHETRGHATHSLARPNNNQPLASAKARPLNTDEPVAYYVNDELQYFRHGPEFIRSRAATLNSAPTHTPAIQQPATPVLNDTAKTEMSLHRLKREQESMHGVIKLIQTDMQRIAQDLSQLHAESRIQSMSRSAPSYSQRSTGSQISWRSELHPGFEFDNQQASAQHTNRETILDLRRIIDQLQQQLHQIRFGDNLQARTNHVEQAGYSQAMRLEPRARVANMALTPTSSNVTVTQNYYVGDLMQPPFASATLKLMQYIKATVAPASWTDSRMMQITDPSISLVITQTRQNHDRIAELLRQVRIGTRSYITYQKRR